ncbi:hypothetical protein Goklo_028932 [Gossypium klotzschianum]|uniref:Uncharacterized protein n=1 Tax=Gossypium klotzschianum TaxID=34286 RepID=A0A7J8U2V6_9ROSI|nr:hypothetical protein [Gossypium klotzschianum]
MIQTQIGRGIGVLELEVENQLKGMFVLANIKCWKASDTRQFATLPSTSTFVSGSAHTTTVISHTPVFNSQGHEVETSQSREARYHDLLEHRSNFLERRRRIRSQVRALQRLGSHFENFSGHERSCILSGLHRTGGCTCRVNNRDSNSNDETSARASLSKIVMLAEALFEVLDEIHQQSEVLSSRPSVSSIGPVPAPNEVVELLPVKNYISIYPKTLTDYQKINGNIFLFLSLLLSPHFPFFNK